MSQLARPKSHPVVDQDSLTFSRLPVVLSEDYRLGVIVVSADTVRRPMYQLVMSPYTWATLDHLERRGGVAWAECFDAVDAAYTEVVGRVVKEGIPMISRMVEVRPRRTKPVPVPGSRSADRLGAVCVEIQKLVAQMAPHCDGREVDDEALARFAGSYGKLRAEMISLREAFAEADGQFEIAQAQMVHLMEGR